MRMPDYETLLEILRNANIAVTTIGNDHEFYRADELGVLFEFDSWGKLTSAKSTNKGTRRE